MTAELKIEAKKQLSGLATMIRDLENVKLEINGLFFSNYS